MVKDMLIAFWQNNNRTKPEHILFYRDGVSEGQFREVSSSPLYSSTVTRMLARLSLFSIFVPSPLPFI